MFLVSAQTSSQKATKHEQQKYKISIFLLFFVVACLWLDIWVETSS
jgi:hypothetical protein